jgi:antitoxin YefM
LHCVQLGPPVDVHSIWCTFCTSKIVPVRELRAELSQVIDQVADLRGHVIVTCHGRPAAVFVPVDEYEALKETAEILSDAETMAAIDEGRREVERGKTVTLDDLRRELQSRRRR